MGVICITVISETRGPVKRSYEMAAVDPSVHTLVGYQGPGMNAGTDAHKFLNCCGAVRVYMCVNTITSILNTTFA